MKQALASGLPQLERKLTDAQLDTFCAFGSALVKKNQVMNLTAITEPEQVARLHFLDCIALLGAANFYGKTVIDVGCGAGFPGVPLKIAEPSIDLTLLDSLKKRMDWLESTLPELGIEAQCVAARAEEYALAHREQYDIAVSRAVARLTMLAELCLPLVRVGGHFVAMKSADSDEELSQAAPGHCYPGRKGHPDLGLSRSRHRRRSPCGGDYQGQGHPEALSPPLCKNQAATPVITYNEAAGHMVCGFCDKFPGSCI